MAIKNHFKKLLLDKQAKEERRITIRDAAKESGLSTSTIQRWDQGDIGRFDENVLNALCRFFNCRICDLLEYVED